MSIKWRAGPLCSTTNDRQVSNINPSLNSLIFVIIINQSLDKF